VCARSPTRDMEEDVAVGMNHRRVSLVRCSNTWLYQNDLQAIDKANILPCKTLRHAVTLENSCMVKYVLNLWRCNNARQFHAH
jgi:hypothetical protein